MMNAASPTARHVAIALYVGAAALAVVAAGLLAITVSGSRSLRGSDLAWALVPAVPAGVTAVLAATAAVAAQHGGVALWRGTRSGA